jgi:hypothetical protein
MGRWDGNEQKNWGAITRLIAQLPEQTQHEGVAEMQSRLNRLLANAREDYKSVDYAIYLNLLEDLSLFFHESKLTDAAARVYVPLRVGWLRFAYSGAGDEYRESHTPPDDLVTAEGRWKNDVEAARKNPALQPLLDYVDFLPIALAAHKRIFLPAEDLDKDGEPFTYGSRDYPQLEKLTRDFLAHYPKSSKREAAALLMAKAVSAQSRPYIVQYGVDREGHDVSNWMQMIEPRSRSYQREQFNADRVRAPLDAYEHEFPNGRYAADIRNLRGAFAWRSRDWAAAIDLTVAQLDDAQHRDLQPEAAMRLASIFAELANSDVRADIVDVLRSRPAAVIRLKQFVRKAALNRMHPLRYFGDFLGERLGFNVEYELPPSD